MSDLVNQVNRLSYTRRDIDLIDEEVSSFIKYFIPTIKNTSTANAGRIFLRIIEGLIDKLNYSQDMKFRQSVLRTVTELQAAIDIVKLVRYKNKGVSSATVDLTLSTTKGPAPSGGIAIPQYTVFLTKTSPAKQFITLSSYTIPEGASSLANVRAVQGIRTVGATIRLSAEGRPGETITMPIAMTPHEFIEIYVDGIAFEQRKDLLDSEYNDKHYFITTDENGLSTIHFGDGEYGVKLAPGSTITATYIQSEGEAGNTVTKNTITKVVGSLSSSISVTNDEVASGGSNGDKVEDITRNAPKYASAYSRASTKNDYEALAETVPGVYKALAENGLGASMKLYIMPYGGGIASSSLLSDVDSAVSAVQIYGSALSVKALTAANILIKMKVLLKTSKLSKSVARRRIYEAISPLKLDGTINEDGALYYRNLQISRGFALSDISSILEGLDDGELIDYANYEEFTRYPTPVASNLSTSVEFIGKIIPGSTAGYSTWSVQYATDTTFYIYKDSIKQDEGTVGAEYTSPGGEVSFRLGLTGDTLSHDDLWIFKTSAYRDNIRLDKFEIMALDNDSDLDISIYYPNELEIGE